MKKYFTWKALIANNTPPMQAAKEVGDLHFEELSGKLKGEYTIRISQEHRVAFKIDQGTSTVTVFSIGGHYPKAKK